MPKRPTLGTRVALLSCLAVPAACVSSDGGGDRLAESDRAAVSTYMHHRAQREAQLARQSADAEPTDANTPADAGADADTAEPMIGLPPAGPRFARDAAEAPLPDVAAEEPADEMGALEDTRAVWATRDLALWGHVPETDEHRASPLDAADNLRQVTFSTQGADFDIELDPTGEKLYFASTRHRVTSDIYVKRVDGTAITQLTGDPANDVMPAVSRDGKKLAFASDRSGSYEVYIMDVTGGKPVRLTDDAMQNLHPSFSPDGTQLVYCSYGSTSGVWELVVIDLDRPRSRKIIGHGLFPSWSPVSDTIVYQRPRQRGTRWFSVWTIDLVGGEAASPTELAASANAACITPEWSADGKHIVFCTVLHPGPDKPNRPDAADLWVMKADGSSRTRLTSGRFANLQPAWSSDGAVFFVSDRGESGSENVWQLRPERVLQLVDRVGERPRAAAVPTP